eukprot:GDKJ01002173.1.p3 GENE.GDKJ01002173.1~~GDKJ01002173.1.p3  ORF type:complete len:100 (-),score=10.55 GDKJ01002173.1:3445-3744(-)
MPFGPKVSVRSSQSALSGDIAGCHPDDLGSERSSVASCEGLSQCGALDIQRRMRYLNRITELCKETGEDPHKYPGFALLKNDINVPYHLLLRSSPIQFS